MPVGGIQTGKSGSQAFFFADVQGLPGLIRKCQSSALYARPWRKALTDVLTRGERIGVSRAPGGPGSRLASRMRHYSQKAEVPLFGAVTNGASNRGFRYGFALDAGRARRKSGRRYQFHFRGSGRPTRGWFWDIRDLLEPYFRQRMGQLGKDVEKEWARR